MYCLLSISDSHVLKFLAVIIIVYDTGFECVTDHGCVITVLVPSEV